MCTKSKHAVAGTALAGLAFARSAHAAGTDLIKIALIGSGGRGTGAAINALKNSANPNVKLIAVADAFQNRLDNSLRAIQAQCKDKVDVPEERKFVGLDAYQKAIDSGADLVLICTPPGFRPMQFEAAVKAGKHIFMEKPVAVDAPGVRRVMAVNDEAKRKGLAVAVGHHLRHEVKHKEVIKRIHDGAIGDVCFLRAYFNSSGVWVRKREPQDTEMQYQVNNWYYFNWLSGDHIVEQHVHDLDVMNWIKDACPVKANGMGGRQFRVGPEYGEIYDHHAVEFEYADGTKMYSFCRHIPACWNSFSEHAHGTKGRVEIQGHGAADLYVDGQPPTHWERGPDGHQVEMDDLFAALAAGQSYNEGDYSATSTMTAILGRMATYSGKALTWEEAIGSTLDLSPDGYTWQSTPQPEPGPDGIYPCAVPGVSRAV
ncbi:MAG: Gfo/Idh/MocA family oxidoreductase [Pirellulales bacterium]|nr:Gfo/Idh/MocA family oxidoreductase [Pirellulales bacterium]